MGRDKQKSSSSRKDRVVAMGNSLMKDTFRQIIKSPGRYFAILLIVALGVGFLQALRLLHQI